MGRYMCQGEKEFYGLGIAIGFMFVGLSIVALVGLLLFNPTAWPAFLVPLSFGMFFIVAGFTKLGEAT